jgi:hypothetical protein
MEVCKEFQSEEIVKMKEICECIRQALHKATLKFGKHHIFFEIGHNITGMEKIMEIRSASKQQPPLQRPKSRTKYDFMLPNVLEEEKNLKKVKEISLKLNWKRQRAKAPSSGDLYCRSCGETEVINYNMFMNF